jgi:hypothetical protein
VELYANRYRVGCTHSLATTSRCSVASPGCRARAHTPCELSRRVHYWRACRCAGVSRRRRCWNPGNVQGQQDVPRAG